ncbi:MAG: DUF4347 domain-containing protein, partial [Thiomargarita sp.]|nr:DUF4347 domain-containing protein [Thiomargarita sp.]
MATQTENTYKKADHRNIQSDSLMLALEPRILFDAAAVLTMADEFQDNQPSEIAKYVTPVIEETQSDDLLQAAIDLNTPSRHELVFIDSIVRDYENIIADIRTQSTTEIDFQIIVLDSKQDGIQQISESLKGYTNIDAIHVLSHASDGNISLGNTQLSEGNLTNYANQLTTWQNTLNEDADILLYGCRIAETETGIEFVKDLSLLTQADIAASTDDTGHTDLGGDWHLEYQTGRIETDIAFGSQTQENWHDIAAIATGYTEYYISSDAEGLWDIFFDLDDYQLDKTQGLHFVIGITASTDNTTIHYDHWEDGYDADPLVPGTGPITPTEVFQVDKGDMTKLESSKVPVAPRGESKHYDGRDRIYVIGGSASVSLAVWPESIGTVYALAWEVYPDKPFLSSYTIPVGEDLAPGYDDFDKVYALIQSTTAGNKISVDMNADGDYDDAGDGDIKDQTLEQGEVYELYNVQSGAHIKSTEPVQVQMIVGQGNDAVHSKTKSEARGYSLVPDTLWDNEYYNPVAGAKSGSGKVGGDTDLYLYNPNAAAITINYEDTSGSGSFSIPAKSTLSYSDPTAASHFVPQDSGVYLKSAGGEVFWGIGSGDAEDLYYDWGFALVPTYALTEEYFLSWAPGSSDPTPNDHTDDPTPPIASGSPVYITAVQDNTTISVDYSDFSATNPTGKPDGVIDATYTLDRLAVLKINDPDHEHTGMHISASAPIALAWGEDPDHGNPKPHLGPYMDLGYTPLPLPPEWMNQVILTTEKNADPDSLPPPPILTPVDFTVTIPAYKALIGLNVKDILPKDWEYVDDSTTIRIYNDSAGTFTEYATGNAADPTITLDSPNTGQDTLFWKLSDMDIDSVVLASMEPGETPSATELPSKITPHDYIELVYSAKTTDDTPLGTNKNYVEATGEYDGRNFTTSDDVYIFVTPLNIDKDTNAVGSVSAGDNVQYTISLKNVSTTDEITGVKIDDVLPTGFTYVSTDTINITGASTTRTSTVDPTTGATNPVWDTWTISPGGTVTLTFTAKVGDTVPAGTYDNSVKALGKVGDNDFEVSDDGEVDQDAGIIKDGDPEEDEDVNVGLSLGDRVWKDNGDGTDGVAADGIQNGTEPGVENITVTLLDGTGTTTLKTTVTDSNGNYHFHGLTPGNDYTVEFSNLPAGYGFTHQDKGSDETTDSDPDQSTGRVSITNLTATNNDVDAGIVQVANISGKVLNDDTDDGALDGSNESPIAGTTVQLFTDPDGDGDPADGVQVGTDQTTAADGSYSFTDVTPGKYVV